MNIGVLSDEENFEKNVSDKIEDKIHKNQAQIKGNMNLFFHGQGISFDKKRKETPKSLPHALFDSNGREEEIEGEKGNEKKSWRKGAEGKEGQFISCQKEGRNQE